MSELDPFTFGAEQRCFGCGPHNERGMRLRFRRAGDGLALPFVLLAGLLATETTGAYVATATGTTHQITVSGTGAENATATASASRSRPRFSR